MSDYNQFVLAVNKIFEITARMKQGWNDNDNINIADSIEESKTTVVEAAKLFSTTASSIEGDATSSEETASSPTETTSDGITPITEEVGALGE